MKRNLTRMFVDFSRLGLAITDEEAQRILARFGVISLKRDILTTARMYLEDASAGNMTSAGFVSWAFGKLGISLPVTSVELLLRLERLDRKPQLGEFPCAGDIFVRFRHHKKEGERFGIATNEQTVITVDYAKRTVVEQPLAAFINMNSDQKSWFRILPTHNRWATLVFPLGKIACADDVARIIPAATTPPSPL